MISESLIHSKFLRFVFINLIGFQIWSQIVKESSLVASMAMVWPKWSMHATIKTLPNGLYSIKRRPYHLIIPLYVVNCNLNVALNAIFSQDITYSPNSWYDTSYNTIITFGLPWSSTVYRFTVGKMYMS